MGPSRAGALGFLDGKGLLYLPAANYLDWDFDVVRERLVHPCSVPGLSDGGAHVGTICDGGFPTYLLSYWGRDRPSGRLPIEWIVEQQCAATARLGGLNDRGVLAPGYRAGARVAGVNIGVPETVTRTSSRANSR